MQVEEDQLEALNATCQTIDAKIEQVDRLMAGLEPGGDCVHWQQVADALTESNDEPLWKSVVNPKGGNSGCHPVRLCILY